MWLRELSILVVLGEIALPSRFAMKHCVDAPQRTLHSDRFVLIMIWNHVVCSRHARIQIPHPLSVLDVRVLKETIAEDTLLKLAVTRPLIHGQ